MVESEKPHIFGISEATFHSNDNPINVQIDNYNIFHSDTIDNPNFNVSRVSVYVHKDLYVKIRKDLMNDIFSSIWLEVGHPKQKRILVCNLYREWKYLYQDKQTDISDTLNEQSKRWESFRIALYLLG